MLTLAIGAIRPYLAPTRFEAATYDVRMAFEDGNSPSVRGPAQEALP